MKNMKKTYSTPSTIWVFVKAEAVLQASGGVDGKSISNEGTETMGGRRGRFIFDDDDMD